MYLSFDATPCSSFLPRYPQNIRVLLEDAVQTREQGFVRLQPGAEAVVPAPLPWTTYWAPMQVMDLSRNDLEGIDSLLVVEVPTGNDSSGGGGGDDDLEAARKSSSGAAGGGGAVGAKGSEADGGGEGPRKQVFPLENLQELKLNWNRLHGLPGDMARVLPSLVKLELYGNRIEEIRPPDGPLLRLKVRTQRCDLPDQRQNPTVQYGLRPFVGKCFERQPAFCSVLRLFRLFRLLGEPCRSGCTHLRKGKGR